MAVIFIVFQLSVRADWLLQLNMNEQNNNKQFSSLFNSLRHRILPGKIDDRPPDWMWPIVYVLK